MKIKKDDIVVIIAGKDKGKEGKVLKTDATKGRVVVEGVNMRKKHLKKTKERSGQIVEYEAPLHVSNVMVLDPKSKKGTRVGYASDKSGKKSRIAKKSGESLDQKKVVKKAVKEKK